RDQRERGASATPPPPPPPGADKLFGLRRVRVSPRRSIFVRVIVGMLMVMVLMIKMGSMIVVRRGVVVARRNGGADGDGTVQRLQKGKKCAPLHPQQSHADEHDAHTAPHL